MIGVERERERIPDDHAPWPLLAVETIDDEQMKKFDGEDWAERVLASLLEQVGLTARRMLKEAGRIQDVRQLKLYCYNYDEFNSNKEKE
jgi:hypothetical protein